MGLHWIPETPTEHLIFDDPRFQQGITYGKPRPGHPEGSVHAHIGEVLANVQRFYPDSPMRSQLRLIAIVHDSFKEFVDRSKPKDGENHHGMIARRFAEKFTDDTAVLDVIELHDEAFNAWQNVGRGKPEKAVRRAERLVERLGGNLDLYLAFYRCDNMTGDKSVDNFEWFLEIAKPVQA